MRTPQITYAYAEAGIMGASNVELVVMMYGWILQDLKRAKEAQRAGNIEGRTTEVKHCLAVLEQLQTSLDHSKGGDAAENMDRLYSIARAKLVEASIKGSTEIFDHVMNIFANLLEAWKQVLPNTDATEMHPAGTVPPTLLSSSAGSGEREWVS